MHAPRITLVASLLLLSPVIKAADVRDTLTQLYGGDGITLRDTGVFNHAAHFSEDSLAALNRFSTQALRASAPVVSVDSGLVIEYDPVVEDFVEVSGMLGPMFAERPQTLGEGRVSLGFNYSDTRFSRFDGEDLSDTTVQLSHENVGGPGADVCIGGPPDACYLFENDTVMVDLDIEFTTRLFAAFFDYGLTDRLDVGLMVPVLRTEVDVRAEAYVVEDPTRQFLPRTLHAFDVTGNDGDGPVSRARESHTGIGDVLLRSKYHLIGDERYKVSVAAHLRLPTGDYRQLQGTGRLGGRLSLLAAAVWPLGNGTRLSPHLNVTADLNNSADGTDQAQLVAGIDWGIRAFGAEASVSADLLVRTNISHRGRSSDTLADFAVGAKWRAGASGTVFFGTRIPVNRNRGLRPDVVFELGGQVSF